MREAPAWSSQATPAACAFAVTALLASCTDDSSDPLSPDAAVALTSPPVSADEYRLLQQATFGATDQEMTSLIDLGVEAWIERQIAEPPSLQLPYIRSLPRPSDVRQLHHDRVDVWFRNVLNGNDQLRQRVAFALSEIMVVSQFGGLEPAPFAVASYHDLLVEHAFGNFRDLMEAVTLHPAMGAYLSMLGNRKPNDAAHIRPDENYARELMQLFTIGLVDLNTDGTEAIGLDGQPIPTYDQAIIEGFAHVFTGWNYAGTSFWEAHRTDENQVIPMQLYPDFHDTGPKLLLGGVTLPAGQSGEQDLDAALDNIFNHRNVGPFIATRLIERLVTSNPSPKYVERVAQRFNDNGNGVRGDLSAVVRAILLDPEARSTNLRTESGKLKEPILRLTQFWRAYHAQSASGSYMAVDNLIGGQGPLQAPSVFNFFSPFYAPSGEIKDMGFVAPELEIATEVQNTLLTNFFFSQVFERNSRSPGLGPYDIAIDLNEETAIADNTEALVDRVAAKLLGATMSPTLRAIILDHINQIGVPSSATKAAHAVYLVVSSPEFATQR